MKDRALAPFDTDSLALITWVVHHKLDIETTDSQSFVSQDGQCCTQAEIFPPLNRAIPNKR